MINNKYTNIIKKILKSGKPDISVVIPFHNVELYIADCLDSLLRQKGVSIEVILINDGSTDGTENIVREYMKKHDNMRLYRIDQNGPGYARNYGVQFARGKYIAFLDADDKLVRGIYKRMLHAAENNKAEVCICNAARFNSKRVWSSDLHEKVYRDYKVSTHITESPSLIYDTTSWNKLINREFYQKSGIQFPEHVVYEDILANLDIHLKCNKVIMLAETGYLWRQREEGENASLTQAFFSDANIHDRMLAAEGLVKCFKNGDLPKELTEEIQYKLLETDLRIVLHAVEHMSDEQASMLIEQVNTFVEENIDSSVIESLSIADMQMYDYARKRDIESLRKLIDYRRNNYKNAPVSEQNGVLYANVPEEIIKVNKRTLNDDFARIPRRTKIKEIRRTGDKLEVDAHIFVPRYNVSKSGDQTVKVLLVNEETGQEIEIVSQEKETHYLTEQYGEVSDEVTGTTKNYNYDWAGFSFCIDKNLIGRQKQKTTKYSVIIQYKDRLFCGQQILRGVEYSKIKEYGAYQIKKNNQVIQLKFGARRELQIIVKKSNND